MAMNRVLLYKVSLLMNKDLPCYSRLNGTAFPLIRRDSGFSPQSVSKATVTEKVICTDVTGHRRLFDGQQLTPYI
ncbi:unnamed protein product [Brassica rapa subsp. trilocularis]